MLTYLTSKQINYKAKLDNLTKKSEKVTRLVQQYQEMLKQLQEQGASLSTVRPHYLLSYNEYIAYIKTLDSDNLTQSGQKLSEQKF